MISPNSGERTEFKIHIKCIVRGPSSHLKSWFSNPILGFNQKLLCLHNLVIISEEQKAIISHSYTPPSFFSPFIFFK